MLCNRCVGKKEKLAELDSVIRNIKYYHLARFLGKTSKECKNLEVIVLKKGGKNEIWREKYNLQDLKII